MATSELCDHSTGFDVSSVVNPRIGVLEWEVSARTSEGVELTIGLTTFHSVQAGWAAWLGAGRQPAQYDSVVKATVREAVTSVVAGMTVEMAVERAIGVTKGLQREVLATANERLAEQPCRLDRISFTSLSDNGGYIANRAKAMVNRKEDPIDPPASSAIIAPMRFQARPSSMFATIAVIGLIGTLSFAFSGPLVLMSVPFAGFGAVSATWWLFARLVADDNIAGVRFLRWGRICPRSSLAGYRVTGLRLGSWSDVAGKAVGYQFLRRDGSVGFSVSVDYWRPQRAHEFIAFVKAPLLADGR